MKFTARAPGTCGELAQGTCDDINFLITCPINLYSVAKAQLTPHSPGVIVNGGRDKTQLAVQKLLDFLGVDDTGVILHIDSEIPTGKGMASSTADITAACTATAGALGVRISPSNLAQIALSVEPTDGIMFPGIMVFDHVRGSICRTLPGTPAINILIVDTGGVVDTREFNSRVNLRLLNRLNEAATNRALELIEQGIRKDDPWLIGKGATVSALANQNILPKAYLNQLHNLCLDFGGTGVNVAHSGTVVGLLFPSCETVDWEKVRQCIVANVDCAVWGPYQLIGGGPEVLTKRKGERVWHPYYQLMEAIFGLQQQSME